MAANHEEFLALAKILEAVEVLDTKFKAVKTMPFEMLSPALWAEITNDMDLAAEIFTVFKAAIPESSKMLDNDLLHSHMIAVTSAD